MSSSVGASLESIANLLARGKRYKVPKFQREYSWNNDQIDEFIDDVKSLLGDDVSAEKPYFFGTMVFVRKNTDSVDDDEMFEIVDGQQRITTSVIFIAAVRNILYDMGRDEDAQEFDRQIREKNLLTNEFNNRLKLSKRNNDYFDNWIMGCKKPYDKMRDLHDTANEKLHLAYTKIANDLKAESSKQQDAGRYLIQLCDRFTKLFKVIELTIPTHGQAYQIFKTLNDRGLELSQSDLLKNHLLEKCPNEYHDDVFSDWMDILTTLETIKVDDFLRHYWMGKYESVKKDKIFEKIAEQIKDEQIPEFVKDLKQNAKFYFAINNPAENGVNFGEDWFREHPEWRDVEGAVPAFQQTIECLQELKKINSKVCNIPIMVAINKLAPDEFVELIRMCIVFFFRYKTICGGHATKLEKTMTGVAHDLANGKDISYVKRHHFLHPEIYPEDEAFESSFSKASLSGTLAEYTLLRLYGLCDRFYLMATDKPKRIDHIVPRSIKGTDWEAALSPPRDESLRSYAERLYDRLGNMVPIEMLPREKRVKLYGEKRYEYRDARGFDDLGFDLPDVSDWDLEQIDARQKAMAKRAVQAWRID